MEPQTFWNYLESLLTKNLCKENFGVSKESNIESIILIDNIFDVLSFQEFLTQKIYLPQLLLTLINQITVLDF